MNMKIRMNEQIVPMDDNTIQAQYHTLFIEDTPISFEPVTNEEGEPIEDIYQKVGGHSVYKLFVGDFAEERNGTQRIVNKLQQLSTQGGTLELHISSYGGNVDELLEYYHTINSYFGENVITYLSMGYSAGAIAFLFGTERVIYEHSDWMIHSYSGGAVGKRDDMLKQLAHMDARIQKFFGHMLEPYFTKKELKRISRGDDFWLNSEEMLERGIATHIISNGVAYTAEEYLEEKYPERKEKRIKKEKKIMKKLEKMQED